MPQPVDPALAERALPPRLTALATESAAALTKARRLPEPAASDDAGRRVVALVLPALLCELAETPAFAAPGEEVNVSVPRSPRRRQLPLGVVLAEPLGLQTGARFTSVRLTRGGIAWETN